MLAASLLPQASAPPRQYRPGWCEDGSTLAVFDKSHNYPLLSVFSLAPPPPARAPVIMAFTLASHKDKPRHASYTLCHWFHIPLCFYPSFISWLPLGLEEVTLQCGRENSIILKLLCPVALTAQFIWAKAFCCGDHRISSQVCTFSRHFRGPPAMVSHPEEKQVISS